VAEHSTHVALGLFGKSRVIDGRSGYSQDAALVNVVAERVDGDITITVADADT
jgi:hypothetical protein